jgi:hypothetical protein
MFWGVSGGFQYLPIKAAEMEMGIITHSCCGAGIKAGFSHSARAIERASVMLCPMAFARVSLLALTENGDVILSY